jgi:hypothetical protein
MSIGDSLTKKKENREMKTTFKVIGGGSTLVSLNGYLGSIQANGDCGMLPSAGRGSMPDAAELKLYAEFIIALADKMDGLNCYDC